MSESEALSALDAAATVAFGYGDTETARRLEQLADEVRYAEGIPAKVLSVCPVLLVRDLEASIAYYRDRAGFEEQMRYGAPPTFAIVRRDGCSLMLRTADKPDAIVPLWTVQDKLWNAYFYVDDAAALYRELQERGAHIDYELYDAPYGVREFGIQDADGYDIGFGQVL